MNPTTLSLIILAINLFSLSLLLYKQYVIDVPPPVTVPQTSATTSTFTSTSPALVSTATRTTQPPTVVKPASESYNDDYFTNLDPAAKEKKEQEQRTAATAPLPSAPHASAPVTTAPPPANTAAVSSGWFPGKPAKPTATSPVAPAPAATDSAVAPGPADAQMRPLFVGIMRFGADAERGDGDENGFGFGYDDVAEHWLRYHAMLVLGDGGAGGGSVGRVVVAVEGCAAEISKSSSPNKDNSNDNSNSADGSERVIRCVDSRSAKVAKLLRHWVKAGALRVVTLDTYGSGSAGGSGGYSQGTAEERRQVWDAFVEQHGLVANVLIPLHMHQFMVPTDAAVSPPAAAGGADPDSMDAAAYAAHSSSAEQQQQPHSSSRQYLPLLHMASPQEASGGSGESSMPGSVAASIGGGGDAGGGNGAAKEAEDRSVRGALLRQLEELHRRNYGITPPTSTAACSPAPSTADPPLGHLTVMPRFRSVSLNPPTDSIATLQHFQYSQEACPADPSSSATGRAGDSVVIFSLRGEEYRHRHAAGVGGVTSSAVAGLLRSFASLGDALGMTPAASTAACTPSTGHPAAPEVSPQCSVTMAVLEYPVRGVRQLATHALNEAMHYGIVPRKTKKMVPKDDGVDSGGVQSAGTAAALAHFKTGSRQRIISPNQGRPAKTRETKELVAVMTPTGLEDLIDVVRPSSLAQQLRDVRRDIHENPASHTPRLGSVDRHSADEAKLSVQRAKRRVLEVLTAFMSEGRLESPTLGAAAAQKRSKGEEAEVLIKLPPLPSILRLVQLQLKLKSAHRRYR